MPSTTNRGYSTPTTGSNAGTWGANDLNPNFTLIDNNIGGIATVALSSTTPVVLSSAQHQCGTIRLTGALTADVVLLFPVVSAWWVIDNQTTGNYLASISVNGAGGQNITTPQGVATDVFSDGTNFKFRNLDKPGAYWDYAGATVPRWVINGCTVPPYLLCDGSTFSAGTYPQLNTILGGTTLPDFRGRGRFYLDGGTNRITTGASGIDGSTRFSAGGSQIVNIAQSNLPNVNFTVTIPSGQGSHVHGAASGSFIVSGVGTNAIPSGANEGATTNTGAATLPALTGTAASGGTDAALNKMPPACIGGITMIRAA